MLQTLLLKRGLLVLITGLLIAALLPSLWIAPQGDEAMYLLQSKLIANDGWLPYRDFFQFILPASLYFGALVLKLTGNSVLILRIAIIGLQLSGLYALLSVMGDRLKPSARLFLILFIWTGCIAMSSGLSHHSLGGAIVPWILFFTVRQNPKLSALLCSLLVLTSQVLGVLVTTAALLWLWQGKKEIKSFLIFLLPLPGLFFIHLLITSSLGDFGKAMAWLLQGHYAQTTTFGYFVSAIESLKASMITWTPDRGWVVLWGNWPLAMMVLLVGLLPVIGLVFGSFSLRKPDSLARCLFYFALATILSTLSYSTEYHISQVAWPAFALGIMAIQPAMGNKNTAHQALTVLLFLMIAGTLYQRLQFLPVALKDKTSWITSYGTREEHFWLPEHPQKIQAVEQITKILYLLQSDQPVFIWNASPELYLFSERKPATRYLFVLPGLMSAKQMAEILDVLNVNPPPMMIYDDLLARIGRDDLRYKARGPLTLPTLEAFVQNHYRIIFSESGYTVFVLKAPQK